MPEYGHSHMEDSHIEDSVLIWEYTGQRKLVFWHILRSDFNQEFDIISRIQLPV